MVSSKFLPIRTLLLAGAVFLSSPWALAQARDDAANRTVDLAINKHYLATDFDTARKLLSATIQGCEGTCTPKTLARAWMYQGMVLGVGMNDMPGAKDAFISALALDPDITLDRNLATPEIARVFQELGGKTASSVVPDSPNAASPKGSAASQTGPASGAGSGMSCNLEVTEIETRRPIPVQCRSEQDAVKVQLRYKSLGSKSWTSVEMTKRGNAYIAEIPCKETENAGSLELYVLGEDSTGEDVATFGTRSKPLKVNLVESTTQVPPSYEDAEPPPRCEARQECPPDFPGCSNKKAGGNVDWGNGCDNSSQCKSGLICIDGTCETPPTCQVNDDCDSGSCTQGVCSVVEGAHSRAYKKNCFGLSVAQDLAFVGGRDPCTQANQANNYTACYASGSSTEPFLNEPYPGVKVSTGLVRATTRLLLTYDRAFTANVTAGIRAGFAFGGGPPNGKSAASEGTKFNPFHLEARGKYWFGQRALAQKVRPYMHIGVGIAEVDAKVKMTLYDCGSKPCAANVNPRTLDSLDVDAWKKLGLEFVTLGGGVVFAVHERFGLLVDLNVMYTLPSTAVVLEPSAGVVVGL